MSREGRVQDAGHLSNSRTVPDNPGRLVTLDVTQKHDKRIPLMVKVTTKTGKGARGDLSIAKTQFRECDENAKLTHHPKQFLPSVKQPKN